MTKMQRALKHYNGHKGAATVAHVERNIKSAYPNAYADLTGIQYGKLMSVANISFQDGRVEATKNGGVWAYDNPTDWVGGIGPRISDGKGGHNNAAVINVTADTVTIETLDGKKIVYERIQ